MVSLWILHICWQIWIRCAHLPSHLIYVIIFKPFLKTKDSFKTMEHHAYVLTTKTNLWNVWFNSWMQLNQTRNQCVVVTICRKWWETLGMLICWYLVKILVEEISEFFSWNSKKNYVFESQPHVVMLMYF
jgi:hypothetical protein